MKQAKEQPRVKLRVTNLRWYFDSPLGLFSQPLLVLLVHNFDALPPISSRFGFPGKTNRSWGWLGGGYDEDDDFPWEGEEDEEEEEEDAEEEGSSIAKGVSAGNIEGPAVPTGKVVRLKSRQELQALTGKGGTIVFVSSRSCRACKFLKT